MPTLTDGELRRLADLRPGHPVLSLYLDLDPRQFGTGAARASAIGSLLDDARRRVEDAELDHDQRQGLREDVERVERFFAGEFSAKGARALAVFCSTRAGLFEAIPLGRPVDTRVVLNHSPYVEPLVQAADGRDWLVVLVNRRDARFLRGGPGRLQEVGALSDDVHGQHDQGGWSQKRFERSVDREVDWHVDNVVEAIERRFKRAPFERLLIGGPEEFVPRFEAKLSHPLRERIAGRVDVDVGNATTDQVLAAAAPCFEAADRARERTALDRLAQGVGAAGRGASELGAVLEALNERRVEILLYEEGFDAPGVACPEHAWLGPEGIDRCPVDGEAPERVDSIMESAVESALAQSAEIVVVRHHEDLGPLGRVGAVLRF